MEDDFKKELAKKWVDDMIAIIDKYKSINLDGFVSSKSNCDIETTNDITDPKISNEDSEIIRELKLKVKEIIDKTDEEVRKEMSYGKYDFSIVNNFPINHKHYL
jgi:predicted RNA-binding protein Jag